MSMQHKALVYTMVLASAADRDMTDGELNRMSAMVTLLPVFADFDVHDLTTIASECAEMLSHDDGLDRALAAIESALPPGRLRETAYAIACDVVAADGEARQEELRLLELLRHRLDIDRLVAAAIERGAAARHARK